ncbi:response regulator [Roseomonas chloroacetimidivorans]|uniref:response regulator n=1 Tax=Roseomonas chloroacetimidivorans TaxID=1766656 RepID=UPI003C78C6B7
MPEAAGPLAGSRVLLVEDEYLIADEMRDWLHRAGASVMGPVPDVEQALDLIDEQAGTLDAAVLDANLGEGETAYPIADRLDELGVPYLFATGDVRLIDEPSYQGRPKLEKPVMERELLKALAQLLEMAPARHA